VVPPSIESARREGSGSSTPCRHASPRAEDLVAELGQGLGVVGHCHLLKRPLGGPGIPVFIVASVRRSAPKRIDSIPIWSCAMRCRIRGSPSSPRSWITASRLVGSVISDHACRARFKAVFPRDRAE